VTADWSYDSTTHEVVVTARQGSRFGEYFMSLTVAAVDSSGALHRATIAITPNAAIPRPARIPLAAPPTTVVLDPDVELLAVLSTSRP
jgi:hypothetical protein